VVVGSAMEGRPKLQLRSLPSLLERGQTRATIRSTRRCATARVSWGAAMVSGHIAQECDLVNSFWQETIFGLDRCFPISFV
jgi:hypothetical protein